MACVLLLSVHLHDGQWHGAGEWPPSPARLFQALVAALGVRGALTEDHVLALRWLESLSAPAIAAPPARAGRGYLTYVPNNDLDAVGGDPDRIAEIRTGKTIRPRFVEGEPLFIYRWHFGGGAEEDGYARQVGDIVNRLYQFGRGVDMAWATADVCSEAEAQARLAAYAGQVWRASVDGAEGGVSLRCPEPGTLDSLIERHREQRCRIAGGVFRKPREPRFRLVRYACPPQRLLLELKPADDGRQFQPWPLSGAAELTTRVRDAAAARLAVTGVAASLVERYLIGRAATSADKARRLRIIPLPSIGHAHADSSIRRVLVERPPDCPIPQGSLDLALSSLDIAPHDPETGEVLLPATPVLVPAESPSMLEHYGVGSGRAASVWSSVTPVALPVARVHGRAAGSQRLANEADAAKAVRQALRHAGITCEAAAIRVQREPFFAKGARAEAFEVLPRFPAARLWHVRLTFTTSVEGPLLIGDGRYLGLGLLRPQAGAFGDAFILPICAAARPHVTYRANVVAALRRALMSLARDAAGRIPTLFSGHEEGPGPASSGQHRHVYLFAEDSDSDGLLDRLGIVAPWRVDRSISDQIGDKERAYFEKVACGLRVLRAGAAGVLTLEPGRAALDDHLLFSRASMWVSHTPYRPTRHPSKGVEPKEWVRADLTAECVRRGLPKPDIDVCNLEIGPGGGLQALARLAFTVAVPGPIMLGRNAHRGGGQFAASAASLRHPRAAGPTED